jgi:4-hydroxythreonine-4-phosphate dehydrogenase
MSHHHDKTIIAISIGDYNGIGLEVILKTFADNRIFKDFSAIIYGSSKLVNFTRKNLALNELQFQIINQPEEAKNNNLYVINCIDEEINVNYGESTPHAGKNAVASIKKACEDLKSGKVHALITAPINKHNIQSPEFSFPGHTEYLQETFQCKDVLMILFHQQLRIATLTGHIPVDQIAKQITAEKLNSKIKLFLDSLTQDFGIRKPRLAVLGLNPHAGDEGVIGTEERKIIAPVIEKWREEGHLVYGPYSADGFFGSLQYKTFDGILGMYHDQSLIPFKTMAFGEGVNFTAGLPIVRTSPDHGTAFDIAGKNVADPSSFRSAVYEAIDILQRRKLYAEISKNPLKSNLQRLEADT